MSLACSETLKIVFPRNKTYLLTMPTQCGLRVVSFDTLAKKA